MAEVFEFSALERPRFLVGDAGSAEERLAALRAEAERSGFEQGLARGRDEARAQLQHALQSVQAAEQAAADVRDAYRAKAEAAAVELAFQIAENRLQLGEGRGVSAGNRFGHVGHGRRP